jgi:hypothetical protein
VTRKVTILYEDKVQGVVKEYGPHALVSQCVCDRLNLAPWEMKSLVPNPRNGNGNVRKDCAQNPPKVARDGGLVFAVYDADRVRELVGLAGTACKADVKTKLLQECPWNDRLRIVFLEKNLETVLRAVRACDPSISSEEQWRRAIERKDLSARDIILKAVASPSPPARALRECVLREVPSLAYLVQKIADSCVSLRLPGSAA